MQDFIINEVIILTTIWSLAGTSLFKHIEQIHLSTWHRKIQKGLIVIP